MNMGLFMGIAFQYFPYVRLEVAKFRCAHCKFSCRTYDSSMELFEKAVCRWEWKKFEASRCPQFIQTLPDYRRNTMYKHGTSCLRRYSFDFRVNPQLLERWWLCMRFPNQEKQHGRYWQWIAKRITSDIRMTALDEVLDFPKRLNKKRTICGSLFWRFCRNKNKTRWRKPKISEFTSHFSKN